MPYHGRSAAGARPTRAPTAAPTDSVPPISCSPSASAPGPPLPSRPAAATMTRLKTIGPQASPIATTPSSVSENPPPSPDWRSASCVAARSVAVAAAARIGASPGSTPGAQRPAPTIARVTRTTATEIDRIARPCAVRLLRLSDPPGRKATIVRADTERNSDQTSASAATRSRPGPAATLPQPKNSVTRGSRVRRPSTSAASPARNLRRGSGRRSAGPPAPPPAVRGAPSAAPRTRSRRRGRRCCRAAPAARSGRCGRSCRGPW